ncbi:MAG: nucleotidyltransferase domain-containing protein [Nitrospirae bacterium]|uniref:nucleotidyltransferase domain-containing protein n=1 Tax=Candidatus Magnetobacterium casense TaxID=1455061 RepID=UPI00059044DB|nr:nucleotidyltransferase domain-containing protein [Candidatus Magnetobacterium casensis]MBF0336347.1 nucleotidyltransferase domain-containing protein [Nitrospirota bacterium]
MVTTTDAIIEKIKRYINELEKNNIPIQEVILFGSYAKGNQVETSDIDIALISTAFSGDRFDDRRLIVPYRREIDSRIEPMPFKPEDFDNGGLLADEIKMTGKKLKF